MNRVTLVGHLGGDPESKAIQGGHLCHFSIATNETFSGRDGEKQKRTEWHKIIVFGKLAEVCQKYLRRGSHALVEGKLQTRSWEDQQGQKRFQTEIVATNIIFLDPKSGEQESPTEGYDDIPY